MKKTGIGIKIICACVLLLLVVYAGGCYYYGNHFQRGTLIDQVDVSNLTVQDLADRVDAYFLRIQERKSDGSSYEESIDGKAIHEGDIMGIGDKGLVSVGNDISDVTFDLIKDAVDEDSELISIYYGADVKKEDAEAFAARVEESFPDCDVQNYYGGQPIYYYIVSVE